jgi:hypothetical protein
MKNTLLFLCLLSVGCASNKAPAVVRVEVPIPVPCKITLPAPPAYAVDALPADAGIWDMMAALRADRLQRQAYEAILKAAIEACK